MAARLGWSGGPGPAAGLPSAWRARLGRAYQTGRGDGGSGGRRQRRGDPSGPCGGHQAVF